MSEVYESNATLEQIADRLKSVESVLITTHAKPDGDALGSTVALALALEALGKTVEARVMPPVPSSLSFLTDLHPVTVHEGQAAQHINPPDCVVVVDTGAWSQLDPLHDWLAGQHDQAIVIDHHLHGDDVAATQFIDATAAAACEIVADLIDHLGVDITPSIATALFTGVATDTGWFRFSNTTPHTHEVAAKLKRAGVDHTAVYACTEQGERPEKLQLLRRALRSMELIADGHAAVMTLTPDDFADTGARPDETERFVDIPQMVHAVQIVALVVGQDDGKTRLSLRSKPSDDAVDVNELARRFGGGGHARAAGAKIDRPVSQVAAELIEQIENHLT